MIEDRQRRRSAGNGGFLDGGTIEHSDDNE